jgi:hypothetical protein
MKLAARSLLCLAFGASVAAPLAAWSADNAAGNGKPQ